MLVVLDVGLGSIPSLIFVGDARGSKRIVVVVVSVCSRPKFDWTAYQSTTLYERTCLER